MVSFGKHYLEGMAGLWCMALSSAYVPISAVVVPPFMYEPIEKAAGEVGIFGHGLTCSGHPVPAPAGVRKLELMEDRALMAHAAAMSVPQP